MREQFQIPWQNFPLAEIEGSSFLLLSTVLSVQMQVLHRTKNKIALISFFTSTLQGLTRHSSVEMHWIRMPLNPTSYAIPESQSQPSSLMHWMHCWYFRPSSSKGRGQTDGMKRETYQMDRLVRQLQGPFRPVPRFWSEASSRSSADHLAGSNLSPQTGGRSTRCCGRVIRSKQDSCWFWGQRRRQAKKSQQVVWALSFSRFFQKLLFAFFLLKKVVFTFFFLPFFLVMLPHHWLVFKESAAALLRWKFT